MKSLAADKRKDAAERVLSVPARNRHRCSTLTGDLPYFGYAADSMVLLSDPSFAGRNTEEDLLEKLDGETCPTRWAIRNDPGSNRVVAERPCVV